MKLNLRIVIAVSLGWTASLMGLTAWPCTSFLAQHEGQPVFGNNLDWYESVGVLTVNPRDLHKTALVLTANDSPAEWTSKYGSITFNQYGVELPNGGLNEKGLAVEIMGLDSTRYQVDGLPAVNELQWVQRALDRSATVAELVADAPTVRVSVVYKKVHYLACDATADCSVFEYLDGRLVVTRAGEMPVKTLANNTYAESVAYLRGFDGFGGTASMPTSSQSLDRFVRASILARSTEGTSIPDSAFAILESVSQTTTAWSIVYALQRRRIYFRTKAMPSVRSVSLEGNDFACGARRLLDIDTVATGEVGAQFVDYRPEANRQLVNRSFGSLERPLPTKVVDQVAAYPETCTCSPESGTAAASQHSGGCAYATAPRTRPGKVWSALMVGAALALGFQRRRRHYRRRQG